MRFFVHSGEAIQEVVERYDSATLAAERLGGLKREVRRRVSGRSRNVAPTRQNCRAVRKKSPRSEDLRRAAHAYRLFDLNFSP
jgi:hypothetical protein